MKDTELLKLLRQETGPKILLEALKLYGTTELTGVKSNTKILQWARNNGLKKSQYSDDDIPWCGLYIAEVVRLSGRTPVKGFLRSRNWVTWGVKSEAAELGDILVFSRSATSGHVGIYVGENDNFFYVLGGNQANTVNITQIAKNRLLAIRRPKYINKPANVRKILLDGFGGDIVVSTNEA